MRSGLAGLLMGLAAASLGTTALAQKIECTQFYADTAPDDVLAPCTAVIEDKATSRERQAAALYIRGQGYHNTKRFSLAQEDYDDALKLSPKDAYILQSRANIAFRANRYQEGLEYLDRAYTADPHNARVIRTVATVYMNHGKLDEALEALTEALTIQPNDAYSLMWRSGLFAGQRSFELALKDATAMVAIAPAEINRQGYLDEKGERRDFHVIALKTRADIFAQMGNHQQAENDYAAAIAYKPNADSFKARARYFLDRKGKENDALRDLDAAIKLSPSDSDLFSYKGTALARKKQLKEAIAAFNRAIEIDPDFAGVFDWRASVHKELGNIDLAVDDTMSAVMMSKRYYQQTVLKLRRAGFWRTSDPSPTSVEFHDAVQACVIDERCQ